MQRPLYSIGPFKAAFALAQLLPRPALHALATGLASWSIRASPEAARIARGNLAVATGLEGAALDSLLRENFRAFARMLADYFRCAGDRAERAARLLGTTDGWEHLAAARDAGRGVILVTGHLGHWELGGLALSLRGMPITVVTLPEPSRELMHWRESCRRRAGIETIAVGPGHDFAFLEMLRALREGRCVAMLVDRPHSGTGVTVSQFGRTTEYSNAPAMLAHHTGAPVIPAFILERPDGLYRALALPPIPMATGALRDTLRGNVQRIADSFETIIRQHPQQWFNYATIFSPAPQRED